MSKRPEFDPYQYLAFRRFPLAYQGFVPGHEDLAKKRQREIQVSQAKAYIEELRAKPAHEIQALLREEAQKQNMENAERLRKEEEARFFNLPAAQADIVHWSKAAYWTLEEAIALSFGKDPRIVSWKSIEPLVGVSPFAASYRDLRDLAHRAKLMNHLYDPVLPGFYLAWAGRMGTKIDPGLEEGVVANGGTVADWKTMHDAEKEAHQATKVLLQQQRDDLIVWAKEQHASALEIGKSAVADRETRIRELEYQLAKPSEETPRDVSTRERASLIKLVIGMAIGGYAYDPGATRNTAIAEIASDLDKAGISLDEDTIRKYLREGKDLLPRDQTE